MKLVPGCNSHLPAARLWLAALLGWLLLAGPAQAVPSFARQTQLQCHACHTAYPQLTALGRSFKLHGYTLQAEDIQAYKRLSGMAQPSFTHTDKDQAGGAAQHFGPNDNLALTQASLFYGGRLVGDYDKLGGFLQVTYDGIERTLSWDLADFRWATDGTLAGKPLVWGVDLNNAPSVQDLWNTTPVWGYPFSGSGLAPGPAAATLISDPLGGTVAGLGAYASWNDSLYLEANLYKTLGNDFLKAMGVNGVDQEIDGVAPYWRLSLQHTTGAHYVEAGTFGLYAKTYPGRDHSAGMTDRYLDLGVDSQYQYTGQMSTFTARASWIHENQKLRASTVLGGASNLTNHLNTLALSGSYLYDHTYGLDLGYNHIGGTTDATLYGGSPDSDYFTLQIDWLPLNKVAGVHAPYDTFDPKLSLQYIAYRKFDGSRTNASDNDTLYLQGWLAF
jgi:hypothetical protein